MATATATTMDQLESILGDQAKDLLEHTCQTVGKDLLHLPGQLPLIEQPQRVVPPLQRPEPHAAPCTHLAKRFHHGEHGAHGVGF